jgi:NADH dehydrogenase (ubiquinone) Fe-S protein 3
MKRSNKLLVKFGRYLMSILPFESFQVSNNEVLILVQPRYLFFVLAFLKGHINSQYTILTSIAATDFLDRFNRFEISYELLSLTLNNRLRIKLLVSETSAVESISPLYNSAKWWEREIWDMFGVFFSNHPDLRKILTDYGFEGFPLRKDFPVSGFVEVRFDNVIKRVVCEPLELAQEYRFFTFENPWVTQSSANVKHTQLN